ncbi:MurR/RpiR family transcriptional regulator [Paenibacillus sp. CGMCC 1.18879]|uniref:MurR/RpiR family transcriptional regulator n=1 Tax=Paenibacillus sp. CGMCC 1.18879 TaxID=2834466 RepID=UPI001CA7F29A|nr:hypothetical protein [Paenibacillus sp. CGMCC 1.18879]MBY9077348.1 MurR/RpiR family transcriptional regulator [Paenibacillus sp. CGMCC 1.18879]
MSILYNRLIATMNEETAGSVEYCIATKMIENINLISEVSIGKMAELCSVSKSKISNFIRDLGFDDYSDFRLEAYRERQKEVYIEDGSTVNVTDFMLEYGTEHYIEILRQDMSNLLSKIDYAQIAELVTNIHEYKKVAAFGKCYSETAAMNLQYKMSFYRKFIYTTINDRKQDKYIEEADENTLLIIFSNKGRYISMHQSMDGNPEKECFNKTKAKVVLITSCQEMEHDPRIDLFIGYHHSAKVQNHPFLYQLIIELIAVEYQKKYGFSLLN